MIGGTGNEIYRLNLEQGRFLNPLDLGNKSMIEGVNSIDINPAHQLWSFGIEGDGVAGVRFWDPRSRSQLASLDLPSELLISEDDVASLGSGPLGVTSLASHHNGLSLAVGTSTGHVLLYDLRANKPYATKDQGYGLPIKNLQWLQSASGRYDDADGKIASCDSKVIKIWDKNSTQNYVSLTPESDINDMHILPKTGLIMLANENPDMSSYYVPQLGPAPKWCRFLDNITEELEGDMTGSTGPSAWSDYKFVDKSELDQLNLSHLIGTAALKPYMHGYFMSLELYQTARMVSNPFAYAEHRERQIQDKLEKQTESRIRTAIKPNVKVNKGLVDKFNKNVNKKGSKVDGDNNVFTDDRFKDMFENPDYEIDEDSKEFAVHNPASFNKAKTNVEKEDEESDRDSMDEDMSNSDESESESENEEEENDGSDDDAISSKVIPPKSTNVPTQVRKAKPTLVSGSASENIGNTSDTFGQRIKNVNENNNKSKINNDSESSIRRTGGGGMEMVFMPKTTEADDFKPSTNKKSRGREQIGSGLEKGLYDDDNSHQEQGRSSRRKNVRMASNNALRR